MGRELLCTLVNQAPSGPVVRLRCEGGFLLLGERNQQLVQRVPAGQTERMHASTGCHVQKPGLVRHALIVVLSVPTDCDTRIEFQALGEVNGDADHAPDVSVQIARHRVRTHVMPRQGVWQVGGLSGFPAYERDVDVPELQISLHLFCDGLHQVGVLTPLDGCAVAVHADHGLPASVVRAGDVRADFRST